MNAVPNYRSFLHWNHAPAAAGAVAAGPDDRTGGVYLHDPALQLAAETAIVTQRPLLIRGEPGSGKSSFAPFAARNLDWRYYEMTVTGRTARSFMAVRCAGAAARRAYRRWNLFHRAASLRHARRALVGVQSR